ncbi:MAG: tRNA 2-thiouridine(34) synthase MnmA [Eubacteriales bacterium]|nr:tRNA 2-thiouridine(34) synthase MnmA [Eubacteriales bacterium]MDD4681626.1 tRNA 2-thiouridine(34) synthase MnmA [Eubacteriales bacterium]
MTDEITIAAVPDMRDRPKRVILGISGGVDSSVAALLLQQMGAEVIGMTMITNDDGWAAAADAASVCNTLGIEHIIEDVRNEFADSIIKDFVFSYTSGKTPNPCISCNPKFKFELLYKLAKAHKCDAVSTGHYARIRLNSNGRFAMERAPVGFKDQSYFLSRLRQDQLADLHFPLGTYNKTEVREIALEHNLLTAEGNRIGHKPDSQDNCFIPGSYTEFIEEYLYEKAPELLYLTNPGNIVDEDGRVIGTHKGLIHYTIGQRKGFEVKTTDRLFVIGRDIASNTLRVGAHEKLMRNQIEISDIVYSGLPSIDKPMKLRGRIRHSAIEAECVAYPAANKNKLIVEFEQPVSSPVAGQSCVLYHDGAIVASGFIEDSFLWN